MRKPRHLIFRSDDYTAPLDSLLNFYRARPARHLGFSLNDTATSFSRSFEFKRIKTSGAASERAENTRQPEIGSCGTRLRLKQSSLHDFRQTSIFSVLADTPDLDTASVKTCKISTKYHKHLDKSREREYYKENKAIKNKKDTTTMSERLENYNPGIDRVWKSFTQRQRGESPYSAEIEKKLPEQKIIQYGDGSTVILFGGQGTELDWSDHKWVDDPSRSTVNPMIVTTKSGNRYGFMGGYVLDEKERVGARVGEGVPPICFGEQWEIPMVTESGEERTQRTSRIVSVVVEYKMASPGSGDVRVDGSSPFVELKKDFEQFAQQHGR